MPQENSHRSLLRPHRRPWYKRPWGIFLIIFFVLFWSVSIASGIYVYTVYRGLKTGKISVSDLFPETEKNSFRERVFGVNRPFIGDESAPVIFAVFTDYECTACREASGVIYTLLADEYYKTRARFVIRHFPQVTEHPNALRAALAAECAHEQGKFFAMHRALFDSRDILSDDILKKTAVRVGLNGAQFNSCYDSQKYLQQIETDMQDASDFGVKTAPAFLIRDRIIEGSPTIEALKEAINIFMRQT